MMAEKSNDRNEEEIENVNEENNKESEYESREKTVNKLRKKEIRSILLGNFSVNSEGKTVAGKDLPLTPYGFEDGAQQVLFFGISQKRFIYRSKLKNYLQTRFKVIRTMSDIGRVFTLEAAPDAAACRLKGVFFRPVVLVFEEVKDKEKDESFLQLTAYCGRSPLVIIPILYAVLRFDKFLPKEISRHKRNN